MDWQQFTMRLGSLPPELVEEVFTRHGACSVTLSDAGDNPVLEPAPGETPLWAETRITGLFDAGRDLADLHADLLRSFRLRELPGHRVETLPDREWEREWLKDFRPMAFGKRLWVCPGGFDADSADAVVVRLDPGLAFGTGTHATTALCLEWLDSIDLRGRRVLDYGCGSGILSIAALLLGARSALGIDIDPQAIIATQQNAENNAVADRMATALHGGAIGKTIGSTVGDTIGDTFDILLANILAAPLIGNAERICGYLDHGGKLCLSGILAAQADAVLGAYATEIDFGPAQTRGDWVCLTGTRR